MNIMGYQFMQSLSVTRLTPEKIQWLAHKLPNYAMVINDSLREHIQQINENYSYSMSTWLIFIIEVLGTLIITVGITIF